MPKLLRKHMKDVFLNAPPFAKPHQSNPPLSPAAASPAAPSDLLPRSTSKPIFHLLNSPHLCHNSWTYKTVAEPARAPLALHQCHLPHLIHIFRHFRAAAESCSLWNTEACGYCSALFSSSTAGSTGAALAP